jgi:tagatose-6-phosphate ketose/aldose isomerase
LVGSTFAFLADRLWLKMKSNSKATRVRVLRRIVVMLLILRMKDLTVANCDYKLSYVFQSARYAEAYCRLLDLSYSRNGVDMSQDLSTSAEAIHRVAPQFTLQEILSQPLLWPVTLNGVRSESERLHLPGKLRNARVLVTGAGSSAFAASAVAAAWPRALAVPTTDLLVDAKRYLLGADALVSLARSGDSPESAAVVELVRALRPDILQIAIVCNEDGALAKAGVDGLIVLDPRTNDLSLVMTSAFSNLTLAGLVLAQPDAAAAKMHEFSKRAAALLPEIDRVCARVASRVHNRIVVLSSSPFLGWAREAGLKVLEMCAGQLPVVTETFLGFRHGPMSFVRPDTVVLCLLSSDPVRRLYEMDLIYELHSKKIGYLVGIADPVESEGLFDDVIPAIAPRADDALRTPCEIVGPQLLGYRLSLCMGLNPDNPSPDGIINRVVQGVRIHPAL